MKTLMIDMDDVITSGNFNKLIEDYFNIKIDDRYVNLEGATTKIIFNNWHNKEEKYDDVVRVNNWKEVEEILL